MITWEEYVLPRMENCVLNGRDPFWNGTFDIQVELYFV